MPESLLPAWQGFHPVFQGASWLPGGHAQTLWGKLITPPLPTYRREMHRDSLNQTDIAYDFVDAASATAPLVVLFHGLEGDSRSHYARALMHAAVRHGWNGVVVHFRGCGGLENHADIAYHSGDTAEIAHSLALLRQRYPRLFATGVSLGGNALAKYLGEAGSGAQADAAAVLSAPLDLASAARALQTGVSRRLYTGYFLRSLLPKVRTHHARSPQRFDLNAVLAARHLTDFDDHYTAPVHGFADAADYYRRASAKPLLGKIAIPTLIVNAKNDPFVPAGGLPASAEVSEHVVLMQPEHGGHIGFVCGRFPGHLNWLPEQVLAFFELAAR